MPEREFSFELKEKAVADKEKLLLIFNRFQKNKINKTYD